MLSIDPLALFFIPIDVPWMSNGIVGHCDASCLDTKEKK